MSFDEKDFAGDVSYEKEIGIPVYTDKGYEMYPGITAKLKYCGNEDIGTACAVFAQDKYRTWAFPDLECVKIGIVDSGYFPTWASRYKRDVYAIDSHLEYGMRIIDKQVFSLWKNKKMIQPVAVCCIPLEGNPREPILNDNLIKDIKKILESGNVGKKARVEVCKNFTSSSNLYDQIAKYEENAYKAMNTGLIINNSDYDRQRQAGLEKLRFSCIPVFVQPIAMGKFNVDYFFSVCSELLRFDKNKMDECIKNIDGVSECLTDSLIPVESIPEFVSLWDFNHNDDCGVKKNIKALAQYLADNYESLFIDVYVRGSESNCLTADLPNIINKSEAANKIENFLYDGIRAGGGYAVFASPHSEDCVTAFGIAYDNMTRWKPIPPRYLEKIYHPDFTSRGFSGLKKDCIEFSCAVPVEFVSVRQDKIAEDVAVKQSLTNNYF